MGDSDKPERYRARVVAAAVAVTTLLIAGSAYQRIRVHPPEVAEEATRRQHAQIRKTPKDGYRPEPTAIVDAGAEQEKLAKAREKVQKDLAYQQYVRKHAECGAVREGEPLNLAVVCGPPLSRGAWEAEAEYSELLNAQRRAQWEQRKAARYKKRREMDRAYMEYRAGFPACEAYVEGAMLNDLCGPRPLPRKEWERRAKAGEQADPSGDDPFRGLEFL